MVFDDAEYYHACRAEHFAKRSGRFAKRSGERVGVSFFAIAFQRLVMV